MLLLMLLLIIINISKTHLPDATTASMVNFTTSPSAAYAINIVTAAAASASSLHIPAAPTLAADGQLMSAMSLLLLLLLLIKPISGNNVKCCFNGVIYTNLNISPVCIIDTDSANL